MKLFDAVPNELFSVLASPNRSLYADALDVLYGLVDADDRIAHLVSLAPA